MKAANISAQKHSILHHGNLVVTHNTLEQPFIHRHRRSQDPSPDIGKFSHLKQPLDGAIFAKGAMQHWKDNIQFRFPQALAE